MIITQNNWIQIKLNIDFQVTLGAIKNDAIRVVRWGETKISDKKWHKGSRGTCK